jgi:hypothetical protein
MKTLEAGRQNFGDLVKAFGCCHVLRLRSVHSSAPSVGAEMRSLGRDEKLNQVLSEMVRRRNGYNEQMSQRAHGRQRSEMGTAGNHSR